LVINPTPWLNSIEHNCEQGPEVSSIGVSK